MSDELPELRIGDAERDEAVSLLQEHRVAGRLDQFEFDERLTRALSSRTRGELDALFRDLPGRRPAPPAGSTAVAPAEPPAQSEPHDGTPWYAQWWMIFVAIALTMVTRGRLGPLIPAMAIWLWIIYPGMVDGRRRRHRPLQVSEPTSAEHAEITGLLRQGKKIAAIKAYRDATGADLAYAKAAVDRWERELGR